MSKLANDAFRPKADILENERGAFITGVFHVRTLVL